MADSDVAVLHFHPMSGGKTRGGLATIQTDGNGQATVTFPEPFAQVPASIVLTPHNQLVAAGVLVLTESYVTVWVWDLSAGGWATDREINLYWLGRFD